MIQAHALTKRFEGTAALDGLTLHVPRGAVYGLVGPNGAGKSTLIRHVAGIYRQDSGELLVDGQPVYENPAVKAKLAYIPDEVFYTPQASIRDMMRLYRGQYPGFDAALYTRLGELFALDEKRSIRKLSKGQQKQAAFWLALCLRPELVVLDEPVDGLDPVMRRQVWRLLLSEVAEHGTTVLVSSHNLRELEDVCDHVGILNCGKMLLERSLTQLQEGLVKVQLALPEGATLPEGLDILHHSTTGRLHQLVLRGDASALEMRLQAAQPLFLDLLPLSLEEIFLYELGGEDLDVRDILL